MYNIKANKYTSMINELNYPKISSSFLRFNISDKDYLSQEEMQEVL